MKIIHFNCSCGMKLVAAVRGPGPFRGAKIAFYLAENRRTPIFVCPNCDRDFSQVTVDEFLENVWK